MKNSWAPRVALLAGLGLHDCWQQCLQDEASARNLAVQLLQYIEGFSKTDLIYETADPHVAKILSAWLGLPAAAVTPGPVTVCQSLFGDAWCSFYLPDGAIDAPGEGWKMLAKIADIEDRERPPFLPGLCPSQDGILSVPLPEDLGFSA